MSTNVPQITFGPSGLIIPTDASILAGVQADINAAFGGNVNPALNTPQGQLAVSWTAVISDAYAQFASVVAGMDPAYSTGRFQDAIGNIYFLTRNPAEPTAVQCVCTGLQGVVIPTGALVADTAGNIYACSSGGTIGSGGSITLGFANQVTGPIACPANTVTTIYQSIPGWDMVTNPSPGVVGQVVESATAFEQRREASVALNSIGYVAAIQAAVLAVPGVLDAYTTENATDAPVTVGGVTLAANSLYVCASGGAAQAIAQAIWANKPPGCAMNGNTTETVTDSNSGYQVPLPTYSITFEVPGTTSIGFNVVMANSSGVPSNAAALVEAAITASFAGSDGGPKPRIGSTIFASRFYANIAALGSWAQIIDIQITDSDPAQFTGVISGTTLTVSSVVGSGIAVGQLVYGVGVAPNTVITALGSGTGGNGTYTISISQTVASESMVVQVLANSLTMDIDEEPVLGFVLLALQ